jgi:hypothetical protein
MSDSPEHPATKAEGLAQIEAMVRDADARGKEIEERHLEQLDRLLEAAIEVEVDRLAEPTVAAFQELEKRLRGLGLLSDGDEIKHRYGADPETDDVAVGIEVDGRLYAFGGVGAGDLLIVRVRSGGRHEYGLLGENGEEPTRWYLTTPPPSAASN